MMFLTMSALPYSGKGHKGGFGADGDHLKTKDEVEAALSAGYSMITLDCFDQVKPLANLGNIDLESSYRTPPEEKEDIMKKPTWTKATLSAACKCLWTRGITWSMFCFTIRL